MKRLFWILFCLCTTICSAQDDFYNKKREGYFFYKDEKIEKKKREELKKQQMPVGQTSVEAPMSAKWIKKKLPEFLISAVDAPTDQGKVAAYYYLQRVMMDKAHQFASTAMRVTRSNSFLNESGMFPTHQDARIVVNKKKTKAIKQLLGNLKDDVAVWYFYESNCAICERQGVVLRNFVEESDLYVEAISTGKERRIIPSMSNYRVRNDEGQFERLGLMQTPAIVLARPPNDLFVVSQGLVSRTELEERIIVGLDEWKLIPEHLRDSLFPGDRGVLATGLFDLENVDWNDSESIVKYIDEFNGALTYEK